MSRGAASTTTSGAPRHASRSTVATGSAPTLARVTKTAAPKQAAPKAAGPKQAAPKQAAPKQAAATKRSGAKRTAPRQAATKTSAPKQAAPKRAAKKTAGTRTSTRKAGATKAGVKQAGTNNAEAKKPVATTRAKGAAATQPPPARGAAPEAGLGRAITIRRLELGFSRRVLAARAELSYPYVSEIERGAKVPSSAALFALAQALELTPGALLDRAESLREGDEAPAGEAHRRVPRAPAGRRTEARDAAGADTAAALADVVRAIVRDELFRQPLGRGRSQRPPSGAGGGEHAGITSSAARDRSGDAPSMTEAEVRAQVLAATRVMLSNDELVYDDEGDLPLRRGDVMLFIRVLDDPLSVLVFSPVLVGVSESLSLFERLNALNANMHFVRFCLTHGGVVVDLEVPGDVFAPALLEAACRTIAEAAETVGADLQHDFGGRLFFGDEEVPAARRGTAGYL